jgi:hypothetical protein
VSYATIHQCANDAAFVDRVTACIAQEGDANPVAALGNVIWPVASKSDIEAAYASALAAANPNPGGDEAVISDGMILSAVQSIPVTP